MSILLINFEIVKFDPKDLYQYIQMNTDLF